MSSFTFISMYIGLRSRNPNRIKKIPQNFYGFVYRQSQLGNHNFAKSQSQHGGYVPRAKTACAHDQTISAR